MAVGGRLIERLVAHRSASLTWSLAARGPSSASSWLPTTRSGCSHSDYFLGQVLGLYLVVTIVLFLLEATTDDRSLWLAVIATAALIFAYPLFLPAAAVAFVPLLVDRLRPGRWRTGAPMAPASAGLLVVTALLFFPGRISVGRDILNREGMITPFDVARVGGPATLGLSVAGAVLACVLAVRRRRWLTLAVPLAIAGALAERFGLVNMKSSDFGSTYQATKCSTSPSSWVSPACRSRSCPASWC